MTARPDITIMGGGIFGLSIAYVCARRGRRVRLVERRRIGAGSSGGIVGALAPHVPENWNAKKQFQLESLLMAEPFWAAVAALASVDPGYARTGRLQPLADDRAVEQALARAAEAERLWQGHARWIVDRREADGWTDASPTGLFIRDTLSARLGPRRACLALAAAVRALGGQIDEGQETAPDAPQDEGDAPTIWATGVEGLLALSSNLGTPVGDGVRGQAALFALDAAALPQLFVDGLHIIPHADGTVAVGSTSERDWRGIAGCDARLEALIERARAACPALGTAPVIERWAGIRPRAASRAPVLGPWPGRPGHFIANGGFKIGFGMAPKVAEVMADLVLLGGDHIPEGFRVSDCTPRT